MSKNITLYVTDDNALTFDRAKYYAQGKLSEVVAKLLKKWVEEQKDAFCPCCGQIKNKTDVEVE